LILVRSNETEIIILRDFRPNPVPDFLVFNDALGQFSTNILPALRAIRQAFFNDTWPDRASLIDQPGIFGHAPIADDLLWRDAKTEILVPPVAQFLLVGWASFDIGFIRQAQITAIPASCQDWFHAHLRPVIHSLSG
jgi:hypothetical protein